ncbi:Hypothetical predicted protein [Olea europaea subsp. europaea]|uniref:Uncharacterized protein n=1 Tax=Olea europaea subsp. europaea TaxID=158383 RepID=A0A8S0T5V9_OLEEU|nr:Hypothetical predicted protein [Olea europaea subsp. europaea]
MNLISQKKRSNNSHVLSTPKMSRLTSTNVPPLLQKSRSSSSSTNRFVPPLSLRHSLQANRLVPPLSPTSQSPNTSLHQHHKIVTRSTIENIPTCSGLLIETTHAPTHPEITARTLPNPGVEYCPSNDKLDQPHSHPTSVVRHHSGRKQGSDELRDRFERLEIGKLY